MKNVFVLLFCILALSSPLSSQAQNDASKRIKTQLSDYFLNYSNPAYSNNERPQLLDVTVDEAGHCVVLHASAAFGMQPLTRATIERIRHDVAQLMPPPYNTYQTEIRVNGALLEDLLPQTENSEAAEQRQWGDTRHRGNAWVTPLSRPFDIDRGLFGHHIGLWPSHGYFYDFSRGTWRWQRPRLYCTTEDIFTQSFVVPFLMPMLENAGAVVYSPRERDWQRAEVVVDNDGGQFPGRYSETDQVYAWETGGRGFGQAHTMYFDGENPFEAGTFRRAEAVHRKRQASEIVWQPALPHDGAYAVYVSYATLPTSVSDAEYTVRHRGIDTRFRVNQQMGGGTWVYLGTFDFAASSPADNCVLLSNQSNYRGTVTADAVRFGGGMGSVARGDSLHAPVRSGMPRSLEGSRYYAQWAGMPHSVYRNKEDDNDYAEDINVRSLSVNRLARGSVYLPGDSGLCVPLELCLAIHSDAGHRPDNSIVGSLGIYTTGSYTTTDATFEGPLSMGMLPTRRSRLMSRDLCDMVMTQVVDDIQEYGIAWNRRQMWDRNYSETRLPEVPSMILETMSHQNFADMRLGHDPTFKMLLARAIYKGILHYTSAAHDRKEFVVQPLPVSNFSATLNEQADEAILAWNPTAAPNEPTAMPKGYIVYTSLGDQGYDNGQVVYDCKAKMPVSPGTLTRYKICAFNDGGCSLPSEELCVYAARNERRRLLIVNGFHRLAGPQPVDNDSLRGFDFDQDPGVVYQHSLCYSGRQLNLHKGQGEDFGQSGSEMEGMLVAGNTFDYPTQHARDFLLSDTTLSISSCAAGALGVWTLGEGCQAVDLILGAQRRDGYSLNATEAFAPNLRSFLTDFASKGGSLLVSGAYISEEVPPDFAASVLHCIPADTYLLNDSTATLSGMNTLFSVYSQPNEQCYAVRRLSVLQPTQGAFCSVLGMPLGSSLAVAHQGLHSRTLVYGFPLECISDPNVRRAVMAASLAFLRD